MAEHPRLTEREVLLKRSESTLTDGAARWMRDALTAWADDDYGKVSLAAPQAVELLGKAVLWRTNPALLVPLAAEAEASLFILVERPDLLAPKLRTIGLKQVIGRLDALLGGLPIDAKQRTRMVETRNGAIHVGTAEQSRYVLIDALTLCGPLLEKLDQTARRFYGEHESDVDGLLQDNRTEIGHRVAAKRAKARMLLKRLENDMGENEFEEWASGKESGAEYDIDPNDFGGLGDMYALTRECPECGWEGRLIGSIGISREVEQEYMQVGEDDFIAVEAQEYFSIDFDPSAFLCNVCKLTLTGHLELSAASLPGARLDIEESDLGHDFDVRAVHERSYVPGDQ